jgi:hypothetical protein
VLIPPAAGVATRLSDPVVRAVVPPVAFQPRADDGGEHAR